MALGDESQDGANNVCHPLLCEGAVLDAVQDAPALTQLHHHVNAVSILKHALQTFTSKKLGALSTMAF